MRVDWFKVALALAIGSLVYFGAMAVDSGYTHAWSVVARAVWATGLIVGVLAAVFLLLTGLGILTDEALASVGDRSSPNRGRLTVRLFITVYVVLLFVGVTLGIALEQLYHVDAHRTVLVFCGAFFVLASTRRPWWLYETIRRVRWFAAIESDTAMRVILVLLGAFCIIGGLLAKIE